jgi:hypothetical protein
VVSRSPRADRFGGVVDLSTYSSYVMFEGPIGPQFRWAGTVRRSFIDFILPAVIPKDQLDFTLAPTFYDYTAIFEYEPNSANRLRATFVGSDDRIGIVGHTDNNDPFSGNSFDMKIDWHQGAIRWDATPTAGLVNTLAINLLYYDSVVNFGRGLKVESVALNPEFDDDFAVRLGSWNELRLGVDAGYGDLDLQLNVIRPPKEGHPAISLSGDEIVERNYDLGTYGGGAYIDDVMKPASWVEIIPGVRSDYSEYLQKATADPRLLLKFFPTSAATIKAAAGVYHQWPQGDEIAEGIGNRDLDAEVAYEGVLGFDYDFGQGWTIDTQGYYKDLDDLVSPTEAGDSVPYRNTGIGYVYGGELLARKRLTDRLFGWLSYTYSVSKRRDTPDADWRYFDQDQRHNFIILGSYALGENKQWRLGAKWQFSTGLPYTKIDGAIYNADTDSYSPIYSDQINGRREQAYHQLDIRIDKLWIFNSWTLNTYLDVQNVYWNQYPFGYRYNFDYSERKPVSFPAFMPSIGVDARF